MQPLEYYATPAPDLDGDADDGVEDVNAQPTVVEKDGQRTIVGYAVVWGAISSPRADGYRHVFNRGSVTFIADTLALWHHQITAPLAGNRNATLRLVDDEIGVRCEIDLDQTTDGDNALKRVKSRLVRGMSFGVIPSTMVFAATSDAGVKEVKKAIAVEVTLTAIPAMTATNVVTLDDSKNLSSQMKDQKSQVAKNKLTQLRLAMSRPR